MKCPGLVIAEASTRNDQRYQVSQATVVFSHRFYNGIDSGAITHFQFPADGVGEQLLGHAAGELILTQHDVLSEFGVGVEGISAG